MEAEPALRLYRGKVWITAESLEHAQNLLEDAMCAHVVDGKCRTLLRNGNCPYESWYVEVE